MSAPKFLHLLLVSFSLILLFNLSFSCNLEDEKVLLRIKTHFGNPSSLASWDQNIDCCIGWQNISCNEQGRVNSLDIIDVDDIKGPLPPFLYKLPFLSALSFDNIPNLSGSIPSSFGKLKNLEELSILSTNITGPIPDSFSQLTKLSRLVLSTNGLTGHIPVLPGHNLYYLDLSSNKLTGSIPLSLAQLTELHYLNFSSNKLSGEIPDFMGRHLTNLVTIDLTSNRLSGSIPTSFGLLTNLSSLSISNNRLTGEIPKCLGRGNNMVWLSLANNKFIGDASFLFEKRNTELMFIQLNNNFLKFDFSNVDLARNLAGLNISHNMIYGTLPKRFGQLKVKYVDVSYNQLCGPIPNGRRFKRVSPDIFAHNKCLCGGPLKACK